MKVALQFLLKQFWRGEVVFAGSIALYACGVGAMYADDYIVAIPLYSAAVIWATAKAIAWEEVRGHENRQGITVFISFLGVGCLCLSMLWVRHRFNQVELAKTEASETIITKFPPAPGPPAIAYEKTPKPIKATYPNGLNVFVKPIPSGMGIALAMNNAARHTAIQNVSFTMIEVPTGKFIQSCNIGTVIKNKRLFLPNPCQAFFQVKDDTKWQFEIHTNEDIFMEYVTVTIKHSDFSIACEMTNVSEGARLLTGKCP